MRRQGNRDFGIYMPPTGGDSIRQSIQVDLDLISKLNNVQQGKELGITQTLIDPSEGSVQRSSQVGIELMNRINNIGKDFEGMIRQGWGGNIADSLPLAGPNPSPSPLPSGITSFPSLPLGNLRAHRIDRAMQWRTCPSFCVDYYSLRAGMPTVIHRVCWQLDRWRSIPPSSTASASWNTGSVDLQSWYRLFDSSVPWDTSSDYFIVDQTTRNSCFPMISSTPASTLPPGDFDAPDVDSVMALW